MKKLKLSQQAKNCIGKDWSKGSLTRLKNLANLKRFTERVEKKYGLQDINNLKTKHVTGVFKDLIKEQKSASTLSGYATIARKLASAIGKKNIVPRTNKELGFSRAGTRLQPQTADREKLNDIRYGLYEKAKWLGLAHDLRSQFGLRAKESLLSSKTFEKNGIHLLKVEGTKGGRSRSIEIRTEAQQQLISDLKEYIDNSGGKSILPPEKSLKNCYDLQKNTLASLGAKRSQGTNAHALRHDYVQNRSDITEIQLAEEIGHGRTEVLSHYKK
jgi:hypothetical protein